MATLNSQQIQSGVLELTIAVSVEELQPFLERAAKKLQHENPLPGFRPGKAPFATVKKALGEMALYETAIQYALPSTYVDIIRQEHFETIGDPAIQVTKLTPGQPVEFNAKVAILPEVKMGNFHDIREVRKSIIIEEKEIDNVAKELQDMRAKEILTNRSATKDDRVVVDMNISRGGVVLEGGQARNHKVDLFRHHVIPGFAEHLIGCVAGEAKQFSLPFPKDHYDKKLAGVTVDYEVTIKEVYEFQRPAFDDEFAKSMGKFESADELRNQLKQNLKEMHEARENQRLERAIIDKLIQQTTFGDIPQLLIEAEVKKMFARLKNQVENEGGKWEDYLHHLGKKPDELAKSWLPEATTRVKAALLVRTMAEKEKIGVGSSEIDAEREVILSHYPEEKDADIREEIKSSEYDSHIHHIILTRKVMTLMKDIATQ